MVPRSFNRVNGSPSSVSCRAPGGLASDTIPSPSREQCPSRIPMRSTCSTRNGASVRCLIAAGSGWGPGSRRIRGSALKRMRDRPTTALVLGSSLCTPGSLTLCAPYGPDFGPPPAKRSRNAETSNRDQDGTPRNVTERGGTYLARFVIGRSSVQIRPLAPRETPSRTGFLIASQCGQRASTPKFRCALNRYARLPVELPPRRAVP